MRSIGLSDISFFMEIDFEGFWDFGGGNRKMVRNRGGEKGIERYKKGIGY